MLFRRHEAHTYRQSLAFQLVNAMTIVNSSAEARPLQA